VTRRPRSKLERLIEALGEVYPVPARPELDVLTQLAIMHLVRCGAEPDAALLAIRSLSGPDGAVSADKLAEAPRELVASVCADDQVDDAVGALRAAGEASRGGLLGLDARCRADLDEGRRLLGALPGLTEPLADLLLVCAGAHPLVAPTASATRVVARIGYPGATYAAVARALDEELPAGDGVDLAWRAHHVLDQHGKAACTPRAPECKGCPIHLACAYRGAGDDPAGRLGAGS
jgi:hypothetical protein